MPPRKTSSSNPQMDHAVGEEVLVPAPLEDVARDDPVGAFRDYEAREVLVPQPLEEPVHLPASVLELREHFERLERVDRDQVEAALRLDRRDAGLERVDPVRPLAEEVRGRLRVEDHERSAWDLELQAERSHLLQQARRPLLEAQVETMEAFARRVLEEDRERQRGLHRPRRALDEHEVPPWDTSLEGRVEALH